MSGIAILGLITGALGGGALVDTFGWRAIFLARVPLGILAIALALMALREQRESESPRRFDFRGALTLFVGVAALILFLTLGGRIGWAAPQVLVLAALSAGFLIGFLLSSNPGPGLVEEKGPRAGNGRLSPDVHGDIRELVHPAVLSIRHAGS